ncbi:hypothetical protein Aduo_013072 [Ancylostoma duodenale]
MFRDINALEVQCPLKPSDQRQRFHLDCYHISSPLSLIKERRAFQLREHEVAYMKCWKARESERGTGKIGVG